MAWIRNLMVNDVGDPEAIVAVTVCRKITVGEERAVADYPTTDFRVRKGAMNTEGTVLLAGLSYTFESSPGRFFQPGDVVGWVETLSGASDFYQDES